jgi:hypothetical protein
MGSASGCKAGCAFCLDASHYVLLVVYLMSSFTTPLRYENVDGKKLKLTESFTYHVGSEGSGEAITVHAGFECDGQSYLRLFWFIDHPHGIGAKAGVVHDYLYWLNGRLSEGVVKSYNRKQADAIYLEALIVSGLSKWRSRFRYRMLRIAGWWAWNSHSKRIAQETKAGSIFERVEKLP